MKEHKHKIVAMDFGGVCSICGLTLDQIIETESQKETT